MVNKVQNMTRLEIAQSIANEYFDHKQVTRVDVREVKEGPHLLEVDIVFVSGPPMRVTGLFAHEIMRHED